MEFQDILLLIQTIICAVSLIVSLVALSNANKVKKMMENRNSHNKEKSSQVAIGIGHTQMIKK